MKEKDGCSPEKDTCEQKPFMERAMLVLFKIIIVAITGLAQ